MTQTNTQSVRSDAEAVVNTNRVPTFEEVYAMPYVQESIRALIDQNVRQYPVLASHEDDLRQEVLILLWKGLPRFKAEKASLKTFVRMLLKTSFRIARKKYFSESNLMLANADDIANYEFCDEDMFVSAEKRQVMVQLASISHDRKILREDVEAVLEYATPEMRLVAQRIMDGESVRKIARSLGVDHKTIAARYLRPLRRLFETFF